MFDQGRGVEVGGAGALLDCYSETLERERKEKTYFLQNTSKMEELMNFSLVSL